VTLELSSNVIDMNSGCTVFESRCGKRLHPAELLRGLSWFFLSNDGTAPRSLHARSVPNITQFVFHHSSCQRHYVDWAMYSFVRKTVNKKWEAYPRFWTLRTVDHKYLEGFEMQCWRRIEKISWTDRVKNEVLHRGKEERNTIYTVNRRKSNWTGQIMCNTLLQDW
jgi:hypothetical protein